MPPPRESDLKEMVTLHAVSESDHTDENAKEDMVWAHSEGPETLKKAFLLAL